MQLGIPRVLVVTDYNPCILIPTYDNPETVGAVVELSRTHLSNIVLVDDGSGEPGRLATERAAQADGVTLHRRPENGGKGAAVLDGLRVASEMGFTHAFQIDADGQHDLTRIPAFLTASESSPAALVLGWPTFDESAPLGRLIGRQITRFWTRLEVGGPDIVDSMCGFRVYPIGAALGSKTKGRRMDFDVEIAVRMAWNGTPIINQPVAVRYVPEEEGGVSHFQMFRDNVRISWAHTRLVTLAIVRALLKPLGRGQHPVEESEPPQEAEWLTRRERGTVLGIRTMLFLCTIFGRTVPRIVTAFIMMYYTVFSRAARRASRDYLARIHGHPASLYQVYRHLLQFGLVTLDRVFLLKGKLGKFKLSTNGDEHIQGLKRTRRGAILLGAHVGSFEALRALANDEDCRLNILAYLGNARMINSVFAKISPQLNTRVVSLEPGSIDSLLKVRDLVNDGELVAVLGDRVGLNDREAVVDFLGHPARFPTGPFILASLLECPVYLTMGLYKGGNRYDLYCEPFADVVKLPRGKEKTEALRRYAEQYATRLEYYCRLAPTNWFNFFDFWKRK